jgi:hypothetical protein
MLCPKCDNETVKNTALGKEFYYCRTCKEEVIALRCSVCNITIANAVYIYPLEPVCEFCHQQYHNVGEDELPF